MNLCIFGGYGLVVSTSAIIFLKCFISERTYYVSIDGLSSTLLTHVMKHLICFIQLLYICEYVERRLIDYGN